MKQAGYVCGLYTSPHLERVTERIRIKPHGPSPKRRLLRFFPHLWRCSSSGTELSYFEITTAAAFWWFADRGVDLAILETGPRRTPGRHQHRPIPEVSVIISIAHDHQNFLGRHAR
jgi:dihydrofolate synthase / folylpolyglutamate synthase